MENTSLLSEASKRYLCCYYQLLDEMAQTVMTARLTQGISHNFIVQAIPFHRAAAGMCRNFLEAGEGSKAVRGLAQASLDRLELVNADLEQALPVCARSASPQRELRLYQRRTDLILRETAARMGAAPEGGRLDAVFLGQLLPCHRGAVHMARNALHYGANPELTPILYTIIRHRCKELAQIQGLRGRAACQGGRLAIPARF